MIVNIEVYLNSCADKVECLINTGFSGGTCKAIEHLYPRYSIVFHSRVLEILEKREMDKYWLFA